MRKPSVIVAAALFAATAHCTAGAAEKTPSPPYVQAGSQGVAISVTWDAAAIRKALPPGIRPVSDMAGGIVVYSVSRGYGLGPYTAAYFYVNVEGLDTPEGAKASWMVQGAYGPATHVAATLRAMGYPIRPGEARIEEDGNTTRYAATINGQSILTAKIRRSACEPIAQLENYPAFDARRKRLVLMAIPEVGDWCDAEVVSLDVDPPREDAFAAFKVKAVTGAAEFRNWSFAFTEPKVLPKR
jgi:hypothetical protein